MVNYRFNLCKSPSVFMRCSQRESSNIKDKRSLNSKIHLAVDVSINFIVTGRLCADYKEAIYLTKNINTKLVFADHDYDTNEILSYFNQQNIKPTILPKFNCLHQCGCKDFKKRDRQIVCLFQRSYLFNQKYQCKVSIFGPRLRYNGNFILS